jgi:uncharacterized protein (TIGR03032 family)
MQPQAPFSCSYTTQLPELMQNLCATIAISTYQAGKLVLISPQNSESFSILPRSFAKPMGMELQDNRLVLATKDEVIIFENSTELAKYYPNKPNYYDNLYVPRATFYTGQVDMHDVAFGKEGIWAVNTSFSCLCLVNGFYNFIPKWQPPFISELVSEDRCHLNGLVLENGVPRFISGLGQTNSPQGWRGNIVAGGFLWDLQTNKPILENLPMPHSPILYKNELYMLLSASGELIKIDILNKSYKVIKNLNGFCRGLDIYGDYLFVGMSKLRKNSSTFAKLPFAEKADWAGIKVIHLPTAAFVGEIQFQTSVDEIYSVKIFPNSLKTNVLNTENPLHKLSLSIPNRTFWANPEQLKQ